MHMHRYRSGRRRRGAAVVEFAFVTLVFGFIIIGALEVGRGLMVCQALNDAARRGCRSGIQGGTSTTSIKTDAGNALTDVGLSASATVTVLVNGSSGTDASSASRGDKISVQVTVPASSVYWSSYLFLRGYTLQSEPVVMMRQQ
jgi:Flp pilus assembly protein TadG